MMKLPRRDFCIWPRALPRSSRLSRPSRRAQTYPSRPVRLMVGSPPGGQLDIIARLIGQWLSERLGQPIIVDNRPGAGTNLATEAVVRAPADGHMLLLASATAAINATLYDNLSFNFTRDTAPIASINRIPIVLEVHPSFPARTVSELIAYAKSNPGKVNMGTPSKGTVPFMAAELFKMMTGVNVVHVPYRGDAQVLTDLMGGQVQAAFGGVSASIEHIKAGKLRALAVTTAARLEDLPDIPTVGASCLVMKRAAGAASSRPRTPLPKSSTNFTKKSEPALPIPSSGRSFSNLGVTPLAVSPTDFGKFIGDETEKWGKVVKFAGLKPE